MSNQFVRGVGTKRRKSGCGNEEHTIWSGNANAIRALYGTNQGLQPTDPGRFYNIDEEDFASDLQATHAATLFGMPLDGLIGVCIEDVNRRLDAYLTPVKFNHYDVLLEWYFAPGSYASADCVLSQHQGLRANLCHR